MVEQLYPIFDAVFAPIVAFPNHLAILFISILLTLMLVSFNKILVKKNIREELKKKMEEVKMNLAQAQKEGNKEDQNKFLNDMMKLHNETMKHTLKATLVSMAVIVLILPWVANKYEGLTVAAVPFEIPLIGANLSWLYWYILVSLTVSWVLNRFFGAM